MSPVIKERRHWVAGSAKGEPGQSFDVNLYTGVFGDWADGGEIRQGGIDLCRVVRQVDSPSAPPSGTPQPSIRPRKPGILGMWTLRPVAFRVQLAYHREGVPGEKRAKGSEIFVRSTRLFTAKTSAPRKWPPVEGSSDFFRVFNVAANLTPRKCRSAGRRH